MNRIRKIENDKYQVLITPTHRFDSGFELMIGNWTDEHLRNYGIKQFDTLEDAMELAYLYADISWEKLVLFHKDVYQQLNKIIKQHLDKHSFIVEYEPTILTPDQLKNIMFDRVLNHGNRFRLKYNLNDVIGFHIINPWSNNLAEIANILKLDFNLRITKISDNYGVIKLIGQTTIGTTYEIVLWPTLIAQWAKWVYLHPQHQSDEDTTKKSLKNILSTQKIVDAKYVIR